MKRKFVVLASRWFSGKPNSVKGIGFFIFVNWPTSMWFCCDEAFGFIIAMIRFHENQLSKKSYFIECLVPFPEQTYSKARFLLPHFRPKESTAILL